MLAIVCMDIRTVQFAIESKQNNVPVYIAGRDGDFWRDTHTPSEAVDAAWYGKARYDSVDALNTKPSGVGPWTEVELLDGGGVWWAREAGEYCVGEMGDMPGEAVDALRRQRERGRSSQPVTTSQSLRGQIEDIVQSPETDLYDVELLRWLINEGGLNYSVRIDEVRETARCLSRSPSSIVGQSDDGEFYDSSRFDFESQ